MDGRVPFWALPCPYGPWEEKERRKKEKEIGGESGGGGKRGREGGRHGGREEQGDEENMWRKTLSRGEEETGSQLVDDYTLWVIFLGFPNSKDWFLMFAFSFSLLATSIGWD